MARVRSELAAAHRAWQEGVAHSRAEHGDLEPGESLFLLLILAFAAIQALRGEWLWPIVLAVLVAGGYLGLFARAIWQRRQELDREMPSRATWLAVPFVGLVGIVGLFPAAARSLVRAVGGRLRR